MPRCGGVRPESYGAAVSDGECDGYESSATVGYAAAGFFPDNTADLYVLHLFSDAEPFVFFDNREPPGFCFLREKKGRVLRVSDIF